MPKRTAAKLAASSVQLMECRLRGIYRPTRQAVVCAGGGIEKSDSRLSGKFRTLKGRGRGTQEAKLGDGSRQNLCDFGGDGGGDAGRAVLGGGLCDFASIHRAGTAEHARDDECGPRRVQRRSGKTR